MINLTALIIGVSQSGKTALVNELSGEAFRENYSPTMGVDFSRHRAHEKVNFNLWDAGSEFLARANMTLQVAPHLVLITIDPSQELTAQFDFLHAVIKNLDEKNLPFYKIIVTKKDLPLTEIEINQVMLKIADFKTKIELELKTHMEPHFISAKLNTGLNSVKAFMGHIAKLVAGDFLSSLKKPVYIRYHLFLLEQYEINLSKRFENLSHEPSMKENPQHRDTANQIFFDELEKASGNLYKLEILMTFAKPYINRHNNSHSDKLFGIKNTNHWKVCLTSLRNAGLVELEKQVAKDSTTTATLTDWKQATLFSAHRNNSIVTGAFGKTKTERKIDALIRKLPRP